MSVVTSNGHVAERYSRSLGLLTSAVFGALYAISITVTILSGYFALSGAGQLGPASSTLFWLLVVNLILILGLAAYLAVRLLKLLKPTASEEFAPQLHVRFAMLFSAAAIMPAVLVGIFFAIVYLQGIENWFSPVVETAVEKAEEVARAAFQGEADEIVSEIQPMALDLNQPQAVAKLSEGRIVYTSYLRLQAQRRFFQSAYVLDRSSAILALVELNGAPGFLAPSATAFQAADNGDINLQFENEQNLIRGLYRLQGYDNAYLYVARYAKGGSLKNYQDAQDARFAYRAANQQRGRLARSFSLVYLEAALLVLIGAIWVGLGAANQIVYPIGRLAKAAHQVRDGNLNVKVTPGAQKDELSSLAGDFNEMTLRLRTQRKELLGAHEVSERRRRFNEMVLAGVSAGVFGIDKGFSITFANRSALALLDLGDVDVIGGSLIEYAPFFQPLLAKLTGSQNEQINDVIESGKDESALTLNVSITADATQKQTGYIVTFDDMSRVISDQRSAAWREVAKRIAHEIKNPLTPIQLSAERLRRKYKKEIITSPDIFEKCIDTIVRQVGDIGRMIDEFSSFARMPEPKIAKVNLVTLVSDTAFGQQVALPDFNISIDKPKQDLFIDCDERLVSQAVLNVIKNAGESAQTMGKDGLVPPQISVKVFSMGSRAMVDVQDNGPGWPKHKRAQLMEPYITTRSKGTGLGLAIVKRIMEDHGGSLELLDRPDGKPGAVVRLEFEIKQSSNHKDEPDVS